VSSSQWVRIDVGYLRNPKVRRVGRDGRDLHLAAILYLGEHRIDSGLLPPEGLEVVARDAGIRRPDQVVQALVKHGLWHCEPLTGGFVVHDYDTTNGNQSQAAAAKERKRRERERDAVTRDRHA
jgi:hypothetical protein